MSPTVDDLRGALRDAAEGTVPRTYSAGRLDGVHATVRRRARQRAALTAGVAALAVVGAVGVVRGLPTSLGNRTQAPAASTATTASTLAPTYYEGGKLAGTMEALAEPGSTSSFTVTPTTWNLSIAGFCTPGAELRASTEISINGTPRMWGGCGGSAARAGWKQDETFWRGLGVRLGAPSLTVTLRVVAPTVGTDATAVPSPEASSTPPGTVAVGVYQDVPVASYPFPPAPATPSTPDVADFEQHFTLDQQHPVSLTAATGETVWNGTWTEQVAWSPRLVLRSLVWAPGQYAVSVNGVEVGGYRHWTYETTQSEVRLDADTLAQYGVPTPTEGRQVTVSVTFSGFGGNAWVVSVGDLPQS